jgi:1,3-beta-glucan synthase
VFAIQRGGISKGQRGLHLNEDIYAGMNLLLRGGIIGYCDFTQCGKGRDLGKGGIGDIYIFMNCLGFGSILGFVTKIGTGMAEQLLSREQFYLGMTLPFNRLLSFFYAHPGFHLNNAISMIAIQMFVTILVWFAVYFQVFQENGTANIRGSSELILIASGGREKRISLLEVWMRQSMTAIALVMILAYIPFLSQSFVEAGPLESCKRLLKQVRRIIVRELSDNNLQVFSLTPIFEVFCTQIYRYSLTELGLSMGSARYVGTGRGFATYHVPITRFLVTFSDSSLRFGCTTLLCLILMQPLNWISASTGIFWFVGFSLVYAPFWFNPHAFDHELLLDDYGKFLWWLMSCEDDNRYS